MFKWVVFDGKITHFFCLAGIACCENIIGNNIDTIIAIYCPNILQHKEFHVDNWLSSDNNIEKLKLSHR
jgi:hypothetical protein